MLIDNVTLRKVQLVQLKIAEEIKRICNENGIKYFLTTGTLLGAVRHKGFIPWDDDLDIGMPRNDYDKFLEIAPQKLSSGYFLQTWRNDKDYPLAFAKLRKSGTSFIQSEFKDMDMHHEIWVDIFPYDAFPDDAKDRKIHIFKLRIYRALISVKCKRKEWLLHKNPIWSYLKHIPFILYALTQKRERIFDKYEMVLKKYNNSDTKNVTMISENWVVPRKCIEHFSEHIFEKVMFSVPEYSDLFLRETYGDYMKLPPENERVPKHKVIEVSVCLNETKENYKKQTILFINPVFKQMPWGGERLKTEWNYQIPGNDTGECWAISAHPQGDCTIKGGRYDGYTLSKLWEEEPELFGNTGLDKFPLLVKIIDAKGYTSVQVHPDDNYAKSHEKDSHGKAECWYILDSRDESSIVTGHNANTNKEFNDMLYTGRWDDMIREVHVEKDDFIQIEPGTIHNFGGNIMLLEIQQSSDITYRVYDYGRLVDGKTRELHIDKAIDVITVPAAPLEKSIKKTGNMPPNVLNLLIECDFYKVWKLDINKTVIIEQNQPFMLINVTRGEGTINGIRIQKGDNFILPYRYGDINLQGNMQLIMSACNV